MNENKDEKIARLITNIERNLSNLEWNITGGVTIDDNIENIRCNLKSLKIIIR